MIVLSSFSICISYSCFLSDVSSLSCDSCCALIASVWCDATSATSFNRDTSTLSFDSDSSKDWTRRVTDRCVSCVTESESHKTKKKTKKEHNTKEGHQLRGLHCKLWVVSSCSRWLGALKGANHNKHPVFKSIKVTVGTQRTKTG